MQPITFALFSASRFLLYSSYFTMCSALFSNKHFGRIVAVISSAAAIVCIAQFGLIHIVVNDVKRVQSFVGVDIAAIVWTALLFFPAVGIYRMERRD